MLRALWWDALVEETMARAWMVNNSRWGELANDCPCFVL